jgi:spore coat polysaccharide biosynthesis protein SpsF (cytidylyltransferase family)
MIDGDDICFDYNLYKKAIKTSHKNSIVFYPKNIITGCFLYTLNYENLSKISINSNYDYDSEMAEPIFSIFKIKKKILKIKSLYKNKKIRLTFDYNEDYKLLNIIFNKFKVTENTLDIISFLNKEKNISRINYFRENFFKKNQNIKIKKFIKNFYLQ